VPVPEHERVIFERPNRTGCKSLSELRRCKTTGKVIPGYEVLGKLPKGFRMLFYGIPGSGKSTLALLMANNFPGMTFYASVEEKMGESFLRKLATWEICNQNIIFSDCLSLRELKNDLVGKAVDLVVIDSLTVLAEVPEDDLSRYSQIWISHSNKDESYKGDSSIGHLVDIIIRCWNGAGYVEKNRYAPLCVIRIFEPGEEVGG
jgi:hypothetical protein